MAIRERHLFGPGPSNPYPEATDALARPLLGHLDPIFLTVMDETCEMLRTVWGTSNRGRSRSVRPAAPGWKPPSSTPSARATWWWSRSTACSDSGCATSPAGAAPRWSRVEHEWGQPVDVQRVVEAHPQPEDHRRGARRDLDRRPLRHRRPGGGEGRRAAGHRRRHQHRRHRAARRRLGRRRRLRRHPEVPRRRAGPRPVHDQRPGVRASGREAALVVPRPRHARRLRRGGGRRRASVPTTTPRRRRWS